MGLASRHTGMAVLCAAVATAAGMARAQCDDGLDGLGNPGRQDLIQIGRDGALALAGMRGCGLALETRIGERKLSFVTADLERGWDMETPVDMAGERLRFTQAGVDAWRGQGLRWTVRVSSAETLPEEHDLERLAALPAAARPFVTHARDYCTLIAGNDVFTTLRQCLEAEHDSIMHYLNQDYRDALQGGS